MKKGIVSSVDTSTKTAQVTFPNMDSVVTPEFKVSDHIPVSGINSLIPGNIVLVAFTDSTFLEGYIIARI